MSEELTFVVTGVGSRDVETSQGGGDPRDEVESRLETARDRLADEVASAATVELTRRPPPDTGDESNVDPEARLEELRETILELVGDDDVDDLSEADRRRLQELREEYQFYDELRAATAAPQIRVPALVVHDTRAVSNEAVATALFHPLEPLDPTVIVGDERIDPFTETTLAAAVEDAKSTAGE